MIRTDAVHKTTPEKSDRNQCREEIETDQRRRRSDPSVPPWHL